MNLIIINNHSTVAIQIEFDLAAHVAVSQISHTIWRQFFAILFALAVALDTAATSAIAGAGDLDQTFGEGSGKAVTSISPGNDVPFGIAIQSDGKILAAGTASDNFAVVRYTTNGLLDSSFGIAGIVTTDFGYNDIAYDTKVQADGKILVVGGFWGGTPNNPMWALTRYLTNGTLDSSFGTGGKVTTAFGGGTATSMALQNDGKIVVAGHVWNGSYTYTDFALVRYKSDGSLDTSFNGTGKVVTDIGLKNDYGYSVVIQGDGKIIVSGEAFIGSGAYFAMARYNANGALDASFNGGKVMHGIQSSASDRGRSMHLQPDGKIIMVGSSKTNTYKDITLMRCTTNGTLDTTFGSGGFAVTSVTGYDDEAFAVEVQNDGKILVTGFANNGANDDICLLRFNIAGNLDTSFGSGGKVITSIGSSHDGGRGVSIQSDSKIVITGYANNGTNNDFAVLRYFSIANMAPTNILISGTNVAENLPVSAMVGSFSTQDPDTGNTFMYTLVSGSGSTDNGSFTISGSNLLTAAIFNYEVKSNFSIRIQAADQGGLSTQKVFAIRVTDVNEMPTNILLSSTNVAENLPVGTKVGHFTAQDPDAGNTFIYTLVAGTGSGDNGAFTISGSNLLTAAIFNYEVKSNYSIRVQSADQSSLSTQKVFAINILNVDEPPPSFSEAPIMSGSNMVIRWGSITNKKYTIHCSTNLLSGFTSLQSNIPGTPAINSYTDSLTTVTQKYWKVTTDP